MKKELNIIEVCGGIGASKKALEKLGIKTKAVDYIENNKLAVETYNALNNTNFQMQDLRDWNKNIKADLVMISVPCVDISRLGKQKGADEGSGTASSLIYDSIRVVKKVQPRYVVFENVENIIHKPHVNNFKRYLSELEKEGYNNYYKVLNAKDYDIPQSRKRVFAVSIKKELDKGSFTLFNEKKEDAIKLKENISYKEFLQDDYCSKDVVLDEKQLSQLKDFGASYSFGGSIVKGNIYPTITASYGKVSGNSGKIKCKEGYRILTARECWRLMGFDDEDYEKAFKTIEKSKLKRQSTNRQLYKMAGNSIVTNVLEAIFRNLLVEYIYI